MKRNLLLCKFTSWMNLKLHNNHAFKGRLSRSEFIAQKLGICSRGSFFCNVHNWWNRQTIKPRKALVVILMVSELYSNDYLLIEEKWQWTKTTRSVGGIWIPNFWIIWRVSGSYIAEKVVLFSPSWQFIMFSGYCYLHFCRKKRNHLIGTIFQPS